jgi:serine/threonine protein kinase
MRTPPTPEPTGPSPDGPSSVVPLRPPHPDDAPTVITHARHAPAAPDLGLAVGGRLGHFELVGSLGAGGMAAVLKARDLELGREVALKILPPQMARDPENVTRFKQEARAAARLDHDNVARVFFCGEDQGLHFIAFEFVEGDNLRAVIDRRGPLPPAECVRYLIQVAAGLAHAADRGVVHRDIKPSNIIVSPDGKAKIVDMGLARNLHQSVNGGVTQSGVTLGTFDYISPEQALDPRRADVRSDIYSLGCAFYHALTGRPPVPEGTAAKKLYAHQHEPVLDPRVLNPQVSDGLAAVLSRMMAKDPAKRYQTPAELIAALTVLARQMNLGTDMFPALDPALLPADPSAVQLLPQPPRLPVGLVVGVAALAVALVVLFGLTGPGGVTRTTPWPDSASTQKSAGDPVAGGPAPAAPPAPTGPVAVAATAEDLARLLHDPAVAEVKLQPGKLYDLTALPAGVAVQGKSRVAIDGQSGANPAVLRVAAYPAAAPRTMSPPRGTLTVEKADAVRFHAIRFDVTDGPVSDETGDRPVGVLVADAGRLELSECRFLADPTLAATETAGLAVVRDPKEPATAVNVRNCYFGLRRGVAVQLAGRVKAEVAESAFAPHPAAFALRADPEPAATPSASGEPSELVLRHCSFLLDKGAVAEAEDGGRWAVSAGYCVFASGPQDPAAMMTTPADQPVRRPAVLRLPGDPAAARFAGRPGEPNAYYQADPLADAVRGYSFDECKRWPTTPPPAADPAAVELPASSPPWDAADPVAELDRRPEEPWKAFRMKTSLTQLRTPREFLLGARSLPRAGDKIYSFWPPPPAEAAVGPRVKVWWPDPPAGLKGNLPRYHYENLRAAVAELKPDDELQIRHDGVIAVPQALLEAPKLRVTVKPYPGTRPVLVPDPEDHRLDASLFRLVEGELTLEGLEIWLRSRSARPGDVRSRSAVTVLAGRRCVLRDCVITCDEQDDEKVAAVVLADPDGEMRAAETERRPEARLENCLVRGKGRAVWVQSARPFDLDLANTATALAGPVVAVDPPAKPPPAGASARVRLTRVTAALAGPLLDFHPGRPSAGRPGGWVPVEVETERCLFAAVERGHPLAVVEGGDPMTPAKTFTWTPALTGPNWYANFPDEATFLEVTPADESAEPRSVHAAGWFEFTGEKSDRVAGPVAFERPPASARKLAAVRPGDLGVKSVDVPGAAPGEAGADVKQLPTPTDEPATDR